MPPVGMAARHDASSSAMRLLAAPVAPVVVPLSVPPPQAAMAAAIAGRENASVFFMQLSPSVESWLGGVCRYGAALVGVIDDYWL